jgi:hypothetical protein
LRRARNSPHHARLHRIGGDVPLSAVHRVHRREVRSARRDFLHIFSPLIALIGFAIVSGLLRRAYWALNAARALIGILSLLGIYSVVTGGDMFGAGLFVVTAALVMGLFGDDTNAHFERD